MKKLKIPQIKIRKKRVGRKIIITLSIVVLIIAGLSFIMEKNKLNVAEVNIQYKK